MVAKDDNPEDTAKEGDKEEIIPEENDKDINELDKQEEQELDEYNENEKVSVITGYQPSVSLICKQ